jgi:uncharacterized cupin superfamily protein
MSKSILMLTAATEELEPQGHPILPAWVLSGTPVSRVKNLGRSHDLTSNMVVWECSAGSFNWFYTQDEALFVVSGEAFIGNGKGEECRLGPGDFGFFPAGTSCTWRVPHRVRKVAVVRETMWRPLGLGLKVWSKFRRILGRAGKSPLMLVLPAWASWSLEALEDYRL